MMYLTVFPPTALWCGIGFLAFTILDESLKSVSGGKSYLTSNNKDTMTLLGPWSFPLFTFPVIYQVQQNI